MTALRSMVRKRRRSIVVLAVLLAAAGVLQAVTYGQIAGTTAAERTAFAAQSEALARQVTFLAPVPTDLSTAGGYVTWRVFGSLALLLGMWAAWFAVSIVRDDERAGITDQLLVAGLTRPVLVFQAAGAYAAAATAVVAPVCIGLALTPDIAAVDALLQGVALIVLLVVVFGMALVVAQLVTSDRRAMAGSGFVLLALSLVNSLAESISPLEAIRNVSPFAWYGRSEPLVDAGAFSGAAAAGSLLVAGALIACAAWLFTRRDLGAGVFTRRQAHSREATPRHPRPYSIPVVAALYEWRRPFVMSAGGALSLVTFFTLAVPSIVASLQEVDALRPYLAALADGDIKRGIIGAFLLGTLQLYLALLALSFAARWAEEERTGRLAVALAAPVSRPALVWRRAATVAVATLVIAVTSVALLVLLAPAAGISIGLAAAARTAFVLTLFALSVTAVAALLTAVVPRGAVLGIGLFIGSSYFIREVGPLYGWSDRILDLSVFHLVGNPLVRGPDALRLAILTGAAVGGFAAAALLLRRRDLLRG